MNQPLYVILCLALLFFVPSFLFAEMEWVGPEGRWIKTEAEAWRLKGELYASADLALMDNGIDLDHKGKKDSMSYLAAEYHLNLDLTYQDCLQIFTRFERNGPSDYHSLILGRRHVPTLFGNVNRLRNKEFLPELEEWFADFKFPMQAVPIHLKAGLFPMWIGNGLAVSGYYENIGVEIYQEGERFGTHAYYFRPDLRNKIILGPNMNSEETIGRGYQHSVSDLFALDTILSWKKPSWGGRFAPSGSFQPYLSFLSDRTGAGKRSNLFAVPTSEDLLGTLGADLNLEWGRLSLGFEAAKNFGRAKAVNIGAALNENIVHRGYAIYADAAYDLKELHLKPRSKLIIASGNDLNGSEGGLLPGSVNRAFSVYSPANAFLSDSVYQPQAMGPLVAMGMGRGLHFGVRRPGTFNDPYLFENIIAPNVGVDVTPFERLTGTLDWWYLSAFERGIGSYRGLSKKLSRDLGHELDTSVTFQWTKQLKLVTALGYFIPGQYYTELRDDAGTNFSPLIRGDGEVDNAFYGEMRLVFLL